jgi:hypothetical protein
LRKIEINRDHHVENTFTCVQNRARRPKTLGGRGLTTGAGSPRFSWLCKIFMLIKGVGL